MTKLVSAGFAALVLLVTGCSSGNGAANPNTPETPSVAALCSSLQDWAEAITTVGNAMNDLGTQMSNLEDPLNPPPADDMHAAAADILTAADAADASLLIAVRNIDDAALSDTLRQMNDVTVETARWMGEAARDSDDLVAFASVVMAGMDRLTAMQDTIDSIDTTAFDTYVMDRCGNLPFFGGGTSSAEDTSAKTDVAGLGMEIATYFVDNENLPTLTQPGGVGTPYFLNDQQVVEGSANVLLGGFSGTGATDWCVWVSNDQGDLKTFTYSAQGGLEQGTCS